MEKTQSKGKIIAAFGNLIHVEFEGNIHQGEVCFVELGKDIFSAEVIEIAGNRAKVQVFEDTKGIKLDTEVQFSGHLLEAELGPGLLTSVLDGLQNPLEKIADKAGFFLKRGIYISPLDREKKWAFTSKAKVGDLVIRGDSLGEVDEGLFKHQIMVPFSSFGKYKLTWIANNEEYTVDTTIAKAEDESGREHEFKLMQKWPVKIPLYEGRKIKPKK